MPGSGSFSSDAARAGLTPQLVARVVEREVLGAGATRADAEAAASQAAREGVAGVCVVPSLLPLRLPAVPGTGSQPERPEGQGPQSERSEEQGALELVTVAGFPSGQHAALIKATEARFAVQLGADAVELVASLPALCTDDAGALLAELMPARESVPRPAALRVVLPAGALDEAQTRAAVRTCAQVGADYVVIGTGGTSGLCHADVSGGTHPSAAPTAAHTAENFAEYSAEHATEHATTEYPATGYDAVERAVRWAAAELEELGRLAPVGMSEAQREDAGLVGVKARAPEGTWDEVLGLLAAGATRVGCTQGMPDADPD